MKTEKNLFEKICDYNNLKLAFYKASRRKQSSGSYLYFRRYSDTNLELIHKQLSNQTYTIGNYRQFTISDPKERLITAAAFEERIIHHAIINVLELIFEKQFIYHTYACRKGKGTHSAIKYAQKCCANSKYFLKLDVKKYFDNIDHTILKQKLCRIIADDRCLSLLFAIIESYSTSEGKGVPIGNLTSQYFANYYLSGLDHYVLENLKTKSGLKYYMRYMDDMIIFADTIEVLRKVFDDVNDYVEKKLNLMLKPPIYGSIKNGLPFLGSLIHSDKIVLLREKQRLKKKKIKKIDYLVRTGRITQEKASERITAILATAKFDS